MSVKIIPILVLGVVIGGGLGYLLIHPPLSSKINDLSTIGFDLESQLITLNHTHESLNKEYEAVTQTYERKVVEYEILNRDYDTLSHQYNATIEEYEVLSSTYEILFSRYVEIEENYDELEAQKFNLELSINEKDATLENLGVYISELENDFSENSQKLNDTTEEFNSLKSEYDALLAITSDSFIVDYRTLVDKINLHSIHRTERDKLFITPDDPAVTQLVQELTEGWENSTDWSEYWGDVMILYNWVSDEIEYVRDGYYPQLSMNPALGFEYREDMWQFPNQTLQRMRGDCEDQATLLASMIRNYNIEAHEAYGVNFQYVECIRIQGDDGGHVAVYMAARREIFILDPAGNYYTNSGPPGYADCHKDIYEEVYNWLNHYRNSIPNAYVYHIFTDYYQKKFYSTSEFINWLYAETPA